MNAKKIITTMIGAVIAFVTLAITVSFLSNAPKIENSTDVVFVSSPAKQTAVINPGAVIAEKGSLQFGDFALFQLMNAETSLEFVSANFGEKTEVLDSARARVNAGSVLGVNLLFGDALTLLDDRLAATSKGGSFFFEESVEDSDSEVKISATSVRVLSGSVQLTFLDAENIEVFEGVLLAGEEVKLTDRDIAEIFAPEDTLTRVATWQTKISNFESRFEGESGLISKILAQLPESKANGLTTTINFLKEKFLLNAEVKEDFYAQRLLHALAETAAGDANAVNKLLATPDAKKRALLQKVVAKLSPLTRIFLTDSLTSPAKEKITRLADLSGQLSSFAEISALNNLLKLNQNLIFIANDTGNTKTAQNFLNTAKNGIEAADAESAQLLLRILERDVQTVNSDWLEAWAAVNRERIVTDFDLAKAVTDQLTLAKLLVASGREDLAGTALKELVGLLSQSSAKFSETSLEAVAKEGNELKNRILFLASLRGEVEFDEESYRSWLAEKARLDAQETAEELADEEIVNEEEPEEISPTARPRTPGRVARPKSELDKFMNLLELDDLPTSETQAAEEGMLGDVSESSKDVFLAMGKELTLLITEKNLSLDGDMQETSTFINSTEFKNFLDKYMTEGSVEEYESTPDIAKNMFLMFGLILVMPDSNSDIKEVITGSTATLSYTKSAGTWGSETTSTDLTAKCSIKMVLENGDWKWERRPLTNDNVICVTS
ncbi:hypothetical protein K9N08_03590 [Candidatus Gracilibacteria bacterium]|nr:hypothetical protein [Candidatus Gracilibacteria bacterium]MCF7896891.1 hypothetical protein [Candidatus Gracilibacteria bacterium]